MQWVEWQLLSYVHGVFETLANNHPVSSDSNSLVTFIVGKEGETVKFTAHKEVVYYHSTVLEAAFNSNFIEGQTQTYRLEDTSEDVFKLFMQWIYSQKLVLSALRNSVSKYSWIVEKEFGDLAMLWVLADKLEMPSLQNAALVAIDEISIQHQRIANETFIYIENNTAADSPLRQYTVANCASFHHEAFATTDIPYQLSREFGSYMLRREKGLEAKILKVSDYLVKED
jgi:hypothetical protein